MQNRDAGSGLLGLTDQARNSFTFGFAPAAAGGRFHEIRIRIARPGMRWIARDPSFASPER